MKPMKQMFCEKSIDSSLLLYLQGYNFIQKRCNRYQSDVFETRILCQKVICLSGEKAAKVFYDNNYFKRKGAAPKRIQKSLFGQQGVQGLDGAAHVHRKQMFMSIMTPQNLELLKQLIAKQWEMNSKSWGKKDKIVLYDEVQEILCQVACKWAGVPLRDYEIKQRSNDLGKMVDAFGAVGPRYWQGKCARKRTEKWIKDIICRIRSNQLSPKSDSAAFIIAWHYDLEGKLLNSQIAAVELINILRPIVAIATYITFGALAMHDYPETVRKLQLDTNDYTLMFVQEIRRYYPFAPFVGAIVKRKFVWKNYNFKKGTLVLFDIYGTNHDQRLWRNPKKFYPERFEKWKENAYDFVPQGGGDTFTGHRCAGEMVTIQIMKESIHYLACNLNYKVPKQNLKYCLRRMPTLPKSRFIISNVKPK